MSYGKVKPPYGTPLNRAHPLARGLVGCWLFNEGSGLIANDSSGMGNHGTLTNMSNTLTSGWVGGPNGGALAFDGVNDSVNCGNALNDVLSDEITIIGTTKPTTITGNGAFIFKGSDNFYTWLYTVNLTEWVVNTSVGNGYVRVSTSYLSTTKYQTRAFVYSRTQLRWEQYQNGALLIPTASSLKWGTITKTASSLQFGIYGASNPLTGFISDVMIWNRALSAQEIAYLYSFPYCMFDPLSIDINRETYLIQPKGRLFL